MSQSSDNPVRQARRRGWAQKILPSDPLREHEQRQIARAMSQEELDDITQLWLAGTQAGVQGDVEARDFFRGTFGPWAALIMRQRSS
jgi:hypothetical protein